MQSYLDLMQKILKEGNLKDNRTVIPTSGIFGTMIRHDLGSGFPLLTTKKMFWRGIVEELLFFLRGETDTNKLMEKKINIWKGNTTREFLDSRGLFDYPEGEAGMIYGAQWRDWGGFYEAKTGADGVRSVIRKKDGVDQIANLIHTLKNNPNDRRMIVSAWNVAEIDKMCLPPCHMLYQCYVAEGKLSLMFQMRSVDFGLGFPFNLASYATLTHLLAKLCGYEVGDLIFVGGDTHIYENHKDLVTEQLSRTPYPLPTLKINKDLKTIEDVENLSFDDFELVGYQSHPAIKAEMAV